MKRTLKFDIIDNVVVAIEKMEASDTIGINGERSDVTMLEDVDIGHKIALRDIKAGEQIMKYGHSIGNAIEDIPKGSWVHTHNVQDPTVDWKATGRNAKFDSSGVVELPDIFKLAKLPKLYGYHRKDGKVGFRNHLLVISTVVCANQIVDDLAGKHKEIICIPNPSGCVIVPHEIQRVTDIILGLARNPNVGGVIFVGLGCENINDAEWFFNQVKNEKPAGFIRLHDEGNTRKAYDKLEAMALTIKTDIDKEERQEAAISDIIAGTKCGGSDWTSAVISNPSIGYASDMVNKNGGTVLLGETCGWFGGQDNLVKQARSEQIAKKIIALMEDIYDRSLAVGNRIDEGNPAPGNKKGGITTLLEKSLGNVKKGGTAPVEGVLNVAESPKGKGLYLVDNPGLDTISTFGLSLSSANVIFFTTGRGTPTGSPVVPVIKVSGSPYANSIFGDHIDCDLRKVISGEMTIEEAGKYVFNEMVEVLNGKLTAAERFGCREFAFPLTMSPL
jgi:altronate dehydratase large subunit